MQYEMTSDGLGVNMKPSEPFQAVISADYTSNRLVGRKTIQWHINNKRLDFEKGNQIKEDLIAFLNNGGEGIDLTFDEANMIFGIAYLFTKYEYPQYLECTDGQLFTAMKYKKNLSGWQRQRLRGTLERLSKKKFPMYWTEGKFRIPWMTFDTLFNLESSFQTGNGVSGNQDDHESSKRNLYRISLNKILFGRLSNNFRMLDPFIGRKIRDYRKALAQRPTEYDLRLYDLLLQENKRIVRWNYLKIAQAPMLMDKYIRQRKIKYIRDKLNDLYRMYCDLGYLLDFKIEQPGTKNTVDILYINPDKFYKLRQGKGKSDGI
ncbi:hypothetical protein ACFLT2_03400 [Acidobacteriota bacterium]